MDRSEELLQLVLEYTNLSDETDKLHNRDSLSGYDNSELNCLDAIGRLEQPNVTALAGEMRMTKGAISKILRKLSDKDAVEPYQLGSNRQKILPADRRRTGAFRRAPRAPPRLGGARAFVLPLSVRGGTVGSHTLLQRLQHRSACPAGKRITP